MSSRALLVAFVVAAAALAAAKCPTVYSSYGYPIYLEGIPPTVLNITEQTSSGGSTNFTWSFDICYPNASTPAGYWPPCKHAYVGKYSEFTTDCTMTFGKLATEWNYDTVNDMVNVTYGSATGFFTVYLYCDSSVPGIVAKSNVVQWMAGDNINYNVTLTSSYACETF